MKIDKWLSAYLKADKIKQEQLLTITDVKMDKVGPEREEKPVLFFVELEQGLVLNKTNAGVLADAFGDETNDWVGKKIILFTAKTKFGGKTVQGMRVRVPE